MLKVQYFSHVMQKAESMEKTLMLGKVEGKWTSGQVGNKRWDAMDLSLIKLRETVKDREAWSSGGHKQLDTN